MVEHQMTVGRLIEALKAFKEHQPIMLQDIDLSNLDEEMELVDIKERTEEVTENSVVISSQDIVVLFGKVQ